MRLRVTINLLLVLVTLNFPSNIFGQLSANDSIMLQASFKNALSVYHHSLDKPSGLFNGSQYIPYATTIRDDHPYFLSGTMTMGDIVYDSVLFEDVSMFYDLVKEQVVIDDPYKIYKISLINEKVSAFSLLNHNFIRLEADSINKGVIRTGFYEVLYKGNITLYEKEIKKIQEVINNQELYRIIIPQNNFYLDIGGKFYQVNRKKSLLKILGKRRKEIQQYLRKNKLNYQKDKENTLVKVVTYYDSLK